MNKNILRVIEQRIGAVSGFFGWLAGWLCVAMIGVIFFDVVARYMFAAGSVAMQELEWHLFASMFLLGAAYTMRENANVRVDALYARMSARRRAAVDILGTLFFAIPMCSLILYSSYDFVTYSFAIKEGSGDPGGLPYRFGIKSMLPLGYFLVMVQSLAVICRNVLVLLDRQQPLPADAVQKEHL